MLLLPKENSNKKTKTKITNIKNYEISSNFKIREEDIQASQKIYKMFDKYKKPINNGIKFLTIEKVGSGGQGKAYKVQIEVNAIID
jgi:cell fate (sporulation/competence/biofilm development) regulator YmcA (YheA/YmcA/DUF963 family)